MRHIMLVMCSANYFPVVLNFLHWTDVGHFIK